MCLVPAGIASYSAARDRGTVGHVQRVRFNIYLPVRSIRFSPDELRDGPLFHLQLREDGMMKTPSNPLIRQYFLENRSVRCIRSELDRVVLRLNQRLRTTLAVETPASRLRARWGMARKQITELNVNNFTLNEVNL